MRGIALWVCQLEGSSLLPVGGQGEEGKYIQERSDEKGKETSGRLFGPDSIVRDALIGLRRGTLASFREDFVNLRALAVWVLGNDTYTMKQREYFLLLHLSLL